MIPLVICVSKRKAVDLVALKTSHPTVTGIYSNTFVVHDWLFLRVPLLCHIAR